MSVCGTGRLVSSLRGFSRPPLQSLLGNAPSSAGSPALTPQSTQRLTCTAASPHRSTSLVPECSPVVHHLRFSASAKARLTRRGLTFRRKPRGFGACGSHTCFATHASILTCLHSTAGSPTASTRKQRSPTENSLRCPPKASVRYFSPVTLSAQPRLTSELLRTL